MADERGFTRRLAFALCNERVNVGAGAADFFE
jgi:hypothetical protein